jgi:hypothetical protein
MLITPNTSNENYVKRIERMYEQGLPIDTIIEVAQVDRHIVERVVNNMRTLNESGDWPEPDLSSDFG